MARRAASPALRRSRRPGGLACGLLALLAAAPCLAGGVRLAAQEVTRADVDSTNAAYLTAYGAHQEARRLWEELAGRWESLIDQQDQARERGDESALNRLLADIQDLVVEREDAQAEARQAESLWYEAGIALVQRIGAYQRHLSDQLLQASQGSQDDLLREFDEMRELRNQVDGQMGPREPLTLPEMPIIQALAEDTPVDLRRKAASFEDFAGRLERLLLELDDELERLRNDLQTENQMRAYGRDPFGLRIVPVGTGGTGAGGGGADTTEVELARPTLSQQLEILEQLRENVIQTRDQALAQARELRSRTGGAS